MVAQQIRAALRLAALVALCVSGVRVPTQAATFGSPQDIRAITAIEMTAPAITDIDKLMPYYAPNAVVADWSTPGWYENRDDIAAAFAPQLAVVKSLKVHMDEINVASDGKLACAAMEIHFDALLKDSATPLVMTIRQIDAFKKIDGRWRIIQEHVSLPVDQKTGMGVMDGHLPQRGRLAWSTALALGPAEAPAAAKTEIRAWLDASAAAPTIDEMLRFYGPNNAEILYDMFFPGELRGQKQIGDYYAPLAAATRDIHAKIAPFFVESDGQFGVQISKQDLRLVMKDGTSQAMSFRQSDCLRRVGDKWYSFFEMVSFPVDASNGKAVMASPAASQ
jgi:ketosteroid isomerase-like protein